MGNVLLALSILDPLYSLFGIVIRFILQVFNNYGVAIILFTILIRMLLLPFNVKQHKSSLQQRALNPQLQELKRYYGDDQQGYSQAQMELYKKHKISMFGGCLPALLQLVLIWPVYRIISGPLFYIMQIPEANLQEISRMLVDANMLHESAIRNIRMTNIPILQGLIEAPQVFAEAVNRGLMNASDLINLDFLGLNLGLTPTISPAKLFGAEMATYLPLLLLPLLATGTTIFQSWYSQKTMKTDIGGGINKEKVKNNPALQGQEKTEDMAGQSMKTMLYVMPIMTLFFTFSMPAAMSLYWIVGNFLAIFQVWLFDTIYTKPMASRQAESDAQYEAEIMSRVKQETKRIEDDQPKKKRRKKN